MINIQVNSNAYPGCRLGGGVGAGPACRGRRSSAAASAAPASTTASTDPTAMPMMALVGRPPACDGGGELHTRQKVEHGVIARVALPCKYADDKN